MGSSYSEGRIMLNTAVYMRLFYRSKIHLTNISISNAVALAIILALCLTDQILFKKSWDRLFFENKRNVRNV